MFWFYTPAVGGSIPSAPTENMRVDGKSCPRRSPHTSFCGANVGPHVTCHSVPSYSTSVDRGRVGDSSTDPSQ